MNVIAHYRKTENVYGVLASQEFETQLDPFLAMVEALARNNVSPAQKGAPDAPVDAVINADFGRIEHELAGNSRHDAAPRGATGTETIIRTHMYSHVHIH
jgi:hypothetical protein